MKRLRDIFFEVAEGPIDVTVGHTLGILDFRFERDPIQNRQSQIPPTGFDPSGVEPSAWGHPCKGLASAKPMGAKSLEPAAH